MASQPPNKESHWSQRIAHSGYFLGALLLHLVILLMIATWIIFPRFVPPNDEFTQTYVPTRPAPPPPATSTPTMAVSTKINPNQTAVITTTAVPTFSIPLPNLDSTPTISQVNKVLTPTTLKSTSGLPGRLTGIKAFVQAYRDGGNMNTDGDPHNVKTSVFPVYVASYADGDWDYGTVQDNGNIVAGCMPNLVEKINEWSHGNIKGKVMPQALDIGGPDLLAKKPPFIYFTGHKDFKLTDQEIENLRNYLQNGGAIWGDNALAGAGSRFDVAFQREMKRVIPDPDKNFEPMTMTHEVFTKSWFPITKLPQGINYYSEPIQHLDLDGKLAIIYTPNDYTDLMNVHILSGDTEIDASNPPKFILRTSWTAYTNRDVFFRNLNLESVLAADRLGMNIVGFLLVRFDADILLTP